MLNSGPGSTLIETGAGARFAVGLRGARKARDVGGEDAHAGAVDRDRDGGVVVARAPQRIDDRPEIAFRAPGERVAVGGRVLAELVERRGVLNSALEPFVATRDVDRDTIGNRRRGDGRRAFVPTPKSEEVEGAGAIPPAARDQGRRQRDDNTHVDAIGTQHPTIHQYAVPLVEEGQLPIVPGSNRFGRQKSSPRLPGIERARQRAPAS